MENVSIIIPAYNAVNSLGRCLDSVLIQTYNSLEILIVNDGSNDGTLLLGNKYKKQDSRIQIIDQVNKGVAAARNAGLREASGDYILFIDADDWIEPDMVEKLIAAINEENGLDIAFCSFDNSETPEQIKPSIPFFPEVWDTEKQQLEFLIHKRMSGMLWNKMIRSELFNGILFDESISYGEDAHALWKILKKSRNMIVLGDILYHHVLDNHSISHQKYSHAKYTAISVWEEIAADIKQYYPKWKLMGQERLAATATYGYYEMKCTYYKNNEEQAHLRKIIRNNISVLVKSDNITLKMKVFALAVFLGI